VALDRYRRAIAEFSLAIVAAKTTDATVIIALHLRMSTKKNLKILELFGWSILRI
jgi:hypothetical protein